MSRTWDKTRPVWLEQRQTAGAATLLITETPPMMAHLKPMMMLIVKRTKARLNAESALVTPDGLRFHMRRQGALK